MDFWIFGFMVLWINGLMDLWNYGIDGKFNLEQIEKQH